MTGPLLRLLRTAIRDRRGVSALMVAMAIVVLVGFAGLVIDLGHAFAVQRSLQASADSAALAGAQDITCCAQSSNQVIATAVSYSAVSGGRNASRGLTVTMPNGYPTLKCFQSTGIPCNGPTLANGIVVQQQTTVPLWFAPILGFRSLLVTVTATAGASGGQAKPLDVMLVLDTTQSMNNADSSCSIRNATRLVCALAGVRTILTTLAPSADRIGLMVFPGLTNSSQTQYEYDCSTRPAPTIARYSASPVYQIVPLGSDYRSSNTATSLNSSSHLALASQGVSTCPQGLSAVGGVGTFFADAISAAQAALVSDGRADTQKVIILLSDGDANAPAGNVPTGKSRNQCHQAIAAAQAAAAAGTWVYSIAYGASTANTPGSCNTDVPPISACATMEQIASDPTKFYSDGQNARNACQSNAQSVSELVSVFQTLSYSLLPPRLLPSSVR